MDNPIHDLLANRDSSVMFPSAYDTAWIACLGELAPDLSNRALEWLIENQLPDGSWGAPQPTYYHDRVISTLAAMLALSKRGRRGQDRAKIQKGLAALDEITKNATRGLMADPNGATIGFELIVPTLVAEAEELGIIKQQKERILGKLQRLREIKMRKLRGIKINRFVTMAFSAEMAGRDNQSLLEVDQLQEANGSVAHSPSATAYFATYVRPGDPPSLDYLRRISSPEGAVPDLYPFEVYEKAWILWNFSLIDPLDQQTIDLLQPHLDYLQRAWNPHKGVGLSTGFAVPDGDNTCVTFDLLSRHGRSVDIDGLLSFEDEKGFRCYYLEADASISVNIHAIGALKSAHYTSDSSLVKKVLGFLSEAITSKGYWYDKWHISPYYTTAHAVIICAGYLDDLINPAVEWILSTQHADGSWGFFLPTAEETAYCIQALCIARKNGRVIPVGSIKKGAAWLQQHSGPPYPLFWIGKGLYAGKMIVQSAIISALVLAGQL